MSRPGFPSVLEILRPGENSVVIPPDNAGAFIRALGLVLADSELCARISEKCPGGGGGVHLGEEG